MSYFFQPYTKKSKELNSKIFKKYSGTKESIRPRSKFERWFLLYQCEKNPNVISWNYESVRIPYYDSIQKKNRIYVPDFIIQLSDYTNMVVEVKPHGHIFPEILETATLNERELYYYTRLHNNAENNKEKFLEAESWCNRNNYKFLVYTEHGFFSIQK